MPSAEDLLARLEWGKSRQTMAFTQAAQAVLDEVGAQPIGSVARGFVDNWETLIVLTDEELVLAYKKMFRMGLERFSFSLMQAVTAEPEGDRLKLEIRTPSQRRVINLVDNKDARTLAAALKERVHPTAQPTFRPFGAR